MAYFPDPNNMAALGLNNFPPTLNPGYYFNPSKVDTQIPVAIAPSHPPSVPPPYQPPQPDYNFVRPPNPRSLPQATHRVPYPNHPSNLFVMEPTTNGAYYPTHHPANARPYFPISNNTPQQHPSTLAQYQEGMSHIHATPSDYTTQESSLQQHIPAAHQYYTLPQPYYAGYYTPQTVNNAEINQPQNNRAAVFNSRGEINEQTLMNVIPAIANRDNPSGTQSNPTNPQPPNDIPTPRHLPYYFYQNPIAPNGGYLLLNGTQNEAESTSVQESASHALCNPVYNLNFLNESQSGHLLEASSFPHQLPAPSSIPRQPYTTNHIVPMATAVPTIANNQSDSTVPQSIPTPPENALKVITKNASQQQFMIDNTAAASTLLPNQLQTDNGIISPQSLPLTNAAANTNPQIVSINQQIHEDDEPIDPAHMMTSHVTNIHTQPHTSPTFQSDIPDTIDTNLQPPVTAGFLTTDNTGVTQRSVTVSHSQSPQTFGMEPDPLPTTAYPQWLTTTTSQQNLPASSYVISDRDRELLAMLRKSASASLSNPLVQRSFSVDESQLQARAVGLGDGDQMLKPRPISHDEVSNSRDRRMLYNSARSYSHDDRAFYQKESEPYGEKAYHSEGSRSRGDAINDPRGKANVYGGSQNTDDDRPLIDDRRHVFQEGRSNSLDDSITRKEIFKTLIAQRQRAESLKRHVSCDESSSRSTFTTYDYDQLFDKTKYPQKSISYCERLLSSGSDSRDNAFTQIPKAKSFESVLDASTNEDFSSRNPTQNKTRFESSVKADFMKEIIRKARHGIVRENTGTYASLPPFVLNESVNISSPSKVIKDKMPIPLDIPIPKSITGPIGPAPSKPTKSWSKVHDPFLESSNKWTPSDEPIAQRPLPNHPTGSSSHIQDGGHSRYDSRPFVSIQDWWRSLPVDQLNHTSARTQTFPHSSSTSVQSDFETSSPNVRPNFSASEGEESFYKTRLPWWQHTEAKHQHQQRPPVSDKDHRGKKNSNNRPIPHSVESIQKYIVEQCGISGRKDKDKNPSATSRSTTDQRSETNRDKHRSTSRRSRRLDYPEIETDVKDQENRKEYKKPKADDSPTTTTCEKADGGFDSEQGAIITMDAPEKETRPPEPVTLGPGPDMDKIRLPDGLKQYGLSDRTGRERNTLSHRPRTRERDNGYSRRSRYCSSDNGRYHKPRRGGFGPGKDSIKDRLTSFIKDLETSPVRDNCIQTIENTLTASRVGLKSEYRVEVFQPKGNKPTFYGSLRLSGVHLARASGLSKKTLKHKVYTIALDVLTQKSVDEIISLGDKVTAKRDGMNNADASGDITSFSDQSGGDLREKLRLLQQWTRTNRNQNVNTIVQLQAAFAESQCNLAYSFNKTPIYDARGVRLFNKCELIAEGRIMASAIAIGWREAKSKVAEKITSDLLTLDVEDIHSTLMKNEEKDIEEEIREARETNAEKKRVDPATLLDLLINRLRNYYLQFEHLDDPEAENSGGSIIDRENPISGERSTSTLAADSDDGVAKTPNDDGVETTKMKTTTKEIDNRDRLDGEMNEVIVNDVNVLDNNSEDGTNGNRRDVAGGLIINDENVLDDRNVDDKIGGAGDVRNTIIIDDSKNVKNEESISDEVNENVGGGKHADDGKDLDEKKKEDCNVFQEAEMNDVGRAKVFVVDCGGSEDKCNGDCGGTGGGDDAGGGTGDGGNGDEHQCSNDGTISTTIIKNKDCRRVAPSKDDDDGNAEKKEEETEEKEIEDEEEREQDEKMINVCDAIDDDKDNSDDDECDDQSTMTREDDQGQRRQAQSDVLLISKMCIQLRIKLTTLFKKTNKDVNLDPPPQVICQVYVAERLLATEARLSRREAQDGAFRVVRQTLLKAEGGRDVMNNFPSLNPQELKGEDVLDVVHKGYAKITESNRCRMLRVRSRRSGFTSKARGVNDIIILEHEDWSTDRVAHAHCILNQSASMSGLLLEWTCEEDYGVWRCEICLQGKDMSRCVAKTKRDALTLASVKALFSLYETQPIVKGYHAKSYSSSWVTRDELHEKVRVPVPTETVINMEGTQATPIDNNKYGKEEIPKEVEAAIERLVSEFFIQPTLKELVAAPDWASGERKYLRHIAKVNDLRCGTEDKGQGDIVVLAMRLDLAQYVDILKTQPNESQGRYRLLPDSERPSFNDVAGEIAVNDSFVGGIRSHPVKNWLSKSKSSRSDESNNARNGRASGKGAVKKSRRRSRRASEGVVDDWEKSSEYVTANNTMASVDRRQYCDDVDDDGVIFTDKIFGDFIVSDGNNNSIVLYYDEGKIESLGTRNNKDKNDDGVGRDGGKDEEEDEEQDEDGNKKNSGGTCMHAVIPALRRILRPLSSSTPGSEKRSSKENKHRTQSEGSASVVEIV